MSIEKPNSEELATLAKKEEQAGVVDQQTAASAVVAGDQASTDRQAHGDADADEALPLPLEEGDFNSQPGA